MFYKGGTKMGKVYGYVRVSAKDQNEDRQMISMSNIGIPEENIFMDKLSGKDFNRPMYKKLVRKLKPDDLLVLKSIDRLGRNYEEVIDQWRYLTRDKKIDIKILDMPILDTRRDKDLLGTFISDLVLALLSYVSENERTNIRVRQKEGIEAAKARGVHFGKQPQPLPDNFQKIYNSWVMKKISGTEAAKQLCMPISTFYYKANLYRESNKS